MLMPTIVQFDFPFNGPFGKELADSLKDLAKSIADEPGLIWKIWTENPETSEAGGIYLFKNDRTAQNYIEMHSARLAEFGVENANVKTFQVNERLTQICGGPIE